MTDVTLLRMSSRLAAITSALVFAATTFAIAPSAAAEPCSDIKVIFARGTNDAPGLGNPGQGLRRCAQHDGRRPHPDHVCGQLSRVVRLPQAADGAADATNYISALTQQCPSTRIVLGGYSQGAAVGSTCSPVSPPLGNKIGEIGSAPPLPASLVPASTR